MAMLPALFTNTLMDDVFSDPFFSQPVPSNFAAMMAPSTMTTDIKETDDGYQMSIDMPGFTKSDIKVSVKDGYLTVAGSREHNDDEKDKEGKFLRRERYAGACTRSYYVGDSVKSDDVKAHFENGTLTLSVPKAAAQQVESAQTVQIEG